MSEVTTLDGARVVVTGGAGFIGSHVVDALLRDRRPRSVTVVDDLTNGRRENLATWSDDPRMALVVGDVRDRSVMDAVLEDADVVMHLACLGVRHSLHSPEENHSVNADGSLTVGLAARDAGVRLLLHVSSSEVFGTAQYAPMDERHPTWPETVYGGAKLAGEAYARAMGRTYGLPVIVARPFNTYGTRSHHEGDSGEIIPRTIVRMLAGHAPVLYGTGEQTRDFMHVRDTAAGLVALAECPAAIGETVNLGTGRELAMREVCEVIADAVGRPDLAPELLPARPGDVGRLMVDATRMEMLTGWAPRTELVDGIAELVSWFRASGRTADELAAEASTTNWGRAVPAALRDGTTAGRVLAPAQAASR
ncbi:dTDP-glucose 4,6-dehydratase [Georgenia sp. Z1344]|uniref:dTDP-glucose 4,6-dehydratase n=1 Tax=Georgenia sp. Z1344 TaxID=3416706 RepID=UPI003CE67F46